MAEAAAAARPQSATARRPISAQAFQPSVTVQQRVAQRFAVVLTGSTVNEPAHALDMLQTTFARHEAFRALLARETARRSSRSQAVSRRMRSRVTPGPWRANSNSASDFANVSNALLASAWLIVNSRQVNRAETHAALRRVPESGRGPAAMTETDRQRNAQTLSLLPLLTVLADDAASRDQLSAAERNTLKAELHDFSQRMGHPPPRAGLVLARRRASLMVADPGRMSRRNAIVHLSACAQRGSSHAQRLDPTRDRDIRSVPTEESILRQCCPTTKGRFAFFIVRRKNELDVCTFGRRLVRRAHRHSEPRQRTQRLRTRQRLLNQSGAVQPRAVSRRRLPRPQSDQRRAVPRVRNAVAIQPD